MTKALIVVDVQNDFTEGGSLAVEGGDDAARSITRYVNTSGSQYALIVASKDYHLADNDNDGHFSDNPDFVNSWPAHCVQHTPGSDIDPLCALPPDTKFVLKGAGGPAYSAFEGTTTDGLTLWQVLRNAAVTEVDIVGIAFDYCVKATAIDAAAFTLKTTVLKDFTASVNQANDAQTTVDIKSHGADVRGL